MLKVQGMCYYCGRPLPEPGHSHLSQCWIRTAGYREPPVLRYVCWNCRHLHPQLRVNQLVRAENGDLVLPAEKAKASRSRQVKLF